MKNEDLIQLAAETDQALKVNDIALASKNADLILRHNLSAGLAYKGVIAFRENDLDLSEKYLLESFQLNGKQNLALANLIPLYIKTRDFKKAIAFGEQAARAMPNNLSVAINYAAALLQEQRFHDTLTLLNPFFDPNTPNPSVLAGIISAHRGLFQREDAEKYLKIAEKHFGDKHEILRLKADTLAESDPYEALKGFKKALEKDPKNISTKWNMSLVQLRVGDYSEGWVNYDNGLLPEVGKIGRPIPKMLEGIPCITNPEEINKQKWTIAVCEQGIGDQVLFLGILNKFLEEYPKTLLVAEARFHSILKRSFSNLPIYNYGLGPIASKQLNNINGYIPIGSIQKKYRNSREGFIASRSIYLRPDPEKVAKSRELIEQKTGGKRIVGISWKGGYWERAQKTKTLDVELWDPILSLDNCAFISLQYGDVSKEKELLKTKYKNIHWIEGVDFKKDLEGWFALICACDEIVSVSTALVHFAAAAGKKVKLLLSDRGAPFIWGLEDKNSIAYEDVQIYRKNKNQSYDQFFKSVASTIGGK